MLLALAAVVLLAASADSKEEPKSTRAPNIYQGEWPTYSLPGEREPKEKVYRDGPRQGYRETEVAKLAEMISAYVQTHQAGPVKDRDTTRWTFQAQIAPAFGRTWDWGAGFATSGWDKAAGSLIVWFAGDGGFGQPYVIGIPCVYFQPTSKSGVHLRIDEAMLGSTCRIWGEYDPMLPTPRDVPDTGRRVRAHKALVLGVPAETQPDLRQRIDRAISLTQDHASVEAPLADVYIFAAQAFPKEKTYAENAVRELEKLLNPAIPDAEKDPVAMLERGITPARHADWEKRYFFLLGWVQENFRHDYDKALAAYRRVYVNYNQAYGYNDDAMMFSARILARTGKTAEARRLYQELIKSCPQDFWTQDARNELGRLQSGEKPGADWPGEVRW